MKDKTKILYTRKIQIKRTEQAYKELDQMMFLSKNLYNTCLFRERQIFFAKRDCQDLGQKKRMKAFLTNFELSKQLQDENQIDYRALPQAVSQQVCKHVYEDYLSFFSKFKKDKKAKIPHYLDKVKGRHKLSFPKTAISVKELRKGFIKLSSVNTKFRIPDGIDYRDIQQVDVIKFLNCIQLLVMYKVPKVALQTDNGRYFGIDLGLNNLATITASFKGYKPTIYDGKCVKSKNHLYNKYVSKLRSKITIKGKRTFISDKILSLTRNRYNFIEDYFHKISTDIINQAVSNGVGTIIIGKNDGWKQEINLGKRNNQNFVQIPFESLIKKLKYKAFAKGINVITTEESYTSKCSFFNNEDMCKHKDYQGKRIHRGLFRTSDKKTINSDVNGSLNIIRKVVPTFCCETARLEVADVANPLRISFRDLVSKRMSL